MSSCDNSNIKKNYIVTGTEQEILSACTSIYTNTIENCSGNTLDINSSILSTNDINATNITLSGVLSACTGIYTSNIYGCSPITIQDELILKSGLTFNTIPINNSLEKVLVIDSGGDINYRELSTITGGSGTNTFVTGFTYNNSNTFTITRNDDVSLSSTINNVTGLTVNGDLVISGNTNILETPQIDTNPVLQLLSRDSSSGDVKIKPVPNTLNYGLFSQTGDSVTIVNTDVETSIIGGGIGTLSVPINGFQIGDSFESKMYGLLSNGGGQDIRIKLKSGSIILVDSLIQNLVVHSDDVFTLEVNFTIRNIGSAGTAEIITIGTFQATKKNSNNVFGFSFETINNTTFDTTISNTLGITIEWDNASNNNSIKSQLFTLKKVY